MKDYKDVSNTELELLIDEFIRGRNSDRNKKIMKDRLIKGLLFKELEEKYHLSLRSVQKIVYKCQEQIFRHI